MSEENKVDCKPIETISKSFSRALDAVIIACVTGDEEIVKGKTQKAIEQGRQICKKFAQQAEQIKGYEAAAFQANEQFTLQEDTIEVLKAENERLKKALQAAYDTFKAYYDGRPKSAWCENAIIVEQALKGGEK